MAASRSYQRPVGLYVMNPDGSDVLRLTNDSNNDSDAVWSPDTTMIPFVSQATEDSSDIHVVHTDGSEYFCPRDHADLRDHIHASVVWVTPS